MIKPTRMLVWFFLAAIFSLSPSISWSQSPGDWVDVVCTVFPIYAVAREISTGTKIIPKLLLPAQIGCPHDYSLTPIDMEKITRARMVFLNGLGYEPFGTRLFSEISKENLVDCSSGASTLSFGFGDKSPNPHYFTAPKGLCSAAGNISRSLVDLAPDNSDQIMRNLKRFQDSMADVELLWASAAISLSGLPVVVTHGSLDYAVDALKLRVVKRFEVDTESGGSAMEMLDLIETLRREKPRAILADSAHSTSHLLQLSRETGVKIITLDTMTSGPSNPEVGYVADCLKRIIHHLTTNLIGTDSTTLLRD